MRDNINNEIVRRHVIRGLLRVLCSWLVCSMTWPAFADSSDTVVVSVKSVAPVISAYAQVTAIADLPVRALEAGRLVGLRVRPGDAVHAGQVLAYLDGPQAQAWLVAHQQALVAARAGMLSADKTLTATKQLLAEHLVTRQQMIVAERDLAQAKSGLNTANAAWQAAQSGRMVRSPADGTVLSIQAASSENVQPGDSVLTVMSANQLWLSAALYGRDVDQVHIGQVAQFMPTDYQTGIPVRVVSIASKLAPDGSTQVGLLPLVPASFVPWRAGQWGQVVLKGPVRQQLTVPTRALVLDNGRWWVVLRTQQGNRLQPVVPGESQGWQTVILSGLQAGQQVVARNAFLVFHQGIANTYQQPD